MCDFGTRGGGHWMTKVLAMADSRSVQGTFKNKSLKLYMPILNTISLTLSPSRGGRSASESHPYKKLDSFLGEMGPFPLQPRRCGMSISLNVLLHFFFFASKEKCKAFSNCLSGGGRMPPLCILYFYLGLGG